MGVDAIAVVVRVLAYLGLYQAVGAALFVLRFHGPVPALCERVRRLGGAAALCGAALILLQWPLMAARMAGDFSGLTDVSLLRLALHSSHGLAGGWQLIGLMLLSLGLLAPAAAVAIWPGLVAALVAPALTGHTSVHTHRAILAPLLVIHVLIGAFWLGSLVPLWLTVRHERPALAATVLEGFSRIAGWLIPCLGLAGLGMAYLLIDAWSVLHRAYGALLLGKLGVFLLLLGLAALNRWRLTPALPAAPEGARRALQRSILSECLLIAIVLAMTATLTTLYGPDD
jgi:putative copper export protein